jgi:hypothetical protein
MPTDDPGSNSLMYISYREALTSNEKEDMDKNRYGTSISVVALGRLRPPGAEKAEK